MPKIIWHKERIKTAVIILLLISAVALAGRSGYYSAILEKFSSRAPNASISSSATATAAAEGFAVYRPLSMAINFESGTHHGVQYSAAALEGAYARFSGTFGEALGSAREKMQVSEMQWRAALNEFGVYFLFPCEIPVSLLASFLGTDAGAEIKDVSASQFVISCGSEDVRILFQSGDGDFYTCKTDVSLSAILANIELYEENGAVFSYEMPEYSNSYAYTLIPEALGNVQKLAAQPAFSEDFDYSSIFSGFGINTKVMTSYTEADGVQVFIEGDKNLRILPDGTVFFTSSPTNASSSQNSMEDALSIALRLAGGTIGANSGAASPMLSGISYDEAKGQWTVTFHYVAEGILVSLYGQPEAAKIVISASEILRAELNFLSFSLGEPERSILPVSSAVAIAASKKGYLRLVYAEDAAGAFSCGWVVN